MFDTHTLIWWVNGDKKLSDSVTQLLLPYMNQPNSLLVSSISIWEITLLANKKRLQMNRPLYEWLNLVEQLPVLQFIPIDNSIARLSVELPGTFHSDPADRIIVATAMICNACLLTCDEKIRNYPNVKTLW